ncbi:spore coat protein SA [Neobacillus niacini]|uniref:glycosyltransferase family 4 protein n=1 Tax=Neobacillus driksii TaxID=3035913 RepID=UPI00277EBE86|nr:glycosyltransferase family 4 protein [Neobacillus niacini]MDQ0974935.1 spore coat protein SA [Neobacillus niacini]
MGRRLKIAMISPGTFPISGGRSSSIEMLMKKLASLFQKEADVFMFGKRFRKQPEWETKGSITYYRYTSSKGKTYINQSIEQLKVLKPDIIHIENRPRFAKAVRLAIPNAKIVLALQSTLFMSRPYIGKEELVTCLESADAIIVNSHFLKNYMIKETLCSASKISVNHLGVDTDQFQPKWHHEQKAKAELLKKEWGVTDRKILLYSGRLVKIKGVHHILAAMPELVKVDPSIVLVIAGSSLSPTSDNLGYEARLLELAEKVKGHVIFASFITHDEIHTWYQMADLLLVPSAAEPFGLVNVEAMAVGTPVIGTNSGGIPEIIQHGKTGILIDPERVVQELTWQILKLFSRPEKIMKMGVDSAIHVRANFTWVRTAQRQLALYRDLLEKR